MQFLTALLMLFAGLASEVLWSWRVCAGMTPLFTVFFSQVQTEYVNDYVRHGTHGMRPVCRLLGQGSPHPQLGFLLTCLSRLVLPCTAIYLCPSIVLYYDQNRDCTVALNLFLMVYFCDVMQADRLSYRREWCCGPNCLLIVAYQYVKILHQETTLFGTEHPSKKHVTQFLVCTMSMIWTIFSNHRTHYLPEEWGSVRSVWRSIVGRWFVDIECQYIPLSPSESCDPGVQSDFMEWFHYDTSEPGDMHPSPCRNFVPLLSNEIGVWHRWASHNETRVILD